MNHKLDTLVYWDGEIQQLNKKASIVSTIAWCVEYHFSVNPATVLFLLECQTFRQFELADVEDIFKALGELV